jgi:hypothetical protein
MRRAAAFAVCLMALSLSSLMVPVLAAQQAEGSAAAAPVPAQILTAKKVFISNGGGDSDLFQSLYSGGPDRAYNQFYATMKSWGHYELVSAPADADLVLEIRLRTRAATSSGGGVGEDPQFRLLILDPKTHTLLWPLIEHIPRHLSTKKGRDKDFDQTLVALVNDVAKLASLPLVVPPQAR